MLLKEQNKKNSSPYNNMIKRSYSHNKITPNKYNSHNINI